MYLNLKNAFSDKVDSKTRGWKSLPNKIDEVDNWILFAKRDIAPC